MQALTSPMVYVTPRCPAPPVGCGVFGEGWGTPPCGMWDGGAWLSQRGFVAVLAYLDINLDQVESNLPPTWNP